MIRLKHFIYLIAFWILFVFPIEGQGARLDIFQSKKSFSTHFLFKEDIPDLDRVNHQEAEALLKFLNNAESQLKKREEKNLLNLARGYILFLEGQYAEALESLDHKITGNFILEDYRLDMVAQIQKAIAENLMEDKKFEEAVDPLTRANQIYLTLFRAYPDSPIQDHLPRRLAECQKLLGDAHFELKKFRAAWQWYRKALMREFPLNEEHQYEIYLALAKTYAHSGNFDEAIDIYVYLLSESNHTSNSRDQAQQFLNQFESQLKKEKVSTAELYALLNHSQQKNGNQKITPTKKPNGEFKNEKVKAFYAAVSANDLDKVFVSAEEVLREYPGIREGRGILSKTSRKIYDYFQQGKPWIPQINAILKHYPVQSLRNLGFLLWRNQLTDAAARVYETVLANYPAQIKSAHMSLYFLGRIYEDLHQHEKAIGYYKTLLEKYDRGEYTESARFKIPWLYRLQGNLEKARVEFETLLGYLEGSTAFYQNRKTANTSEFVPTTRYWLAQTLGELNKEKEKEVELHKLVELHPISFYSVLARLELGMDPLGFLKNEDLPKPVTRLPGLGEIGRKKLNRAEKLIAIGFFQYGLEELSEVTQGRENKEFLYYLSQLFFQAGGFQRSIGISWSLSQENNHDSIPYPVMQTLFPQAHIDSAKTQSKNYKINPYLVLALMRQESAFNSRIQSSANAVGLMQLIPPTARYVAKSLGERPPEVDDLKDPDLNIKLGVKYLNQLLDMFQDNLVFALAAYNAGPNKIKRWIEIRSSLKPMEFIESIPYVETRNYVKKVLRNYVIYKTLYEKAQPSKLEDILSVRD